MMRPLQRRELELLQVALKNAADRAREDLNPITERLLLELLRDVESKPLRMTA